MDCIARFLRGRGQWLLAVSSVIVLGGCVQAKLLKYASFQDRQYSSREKPAEIQKKTTAELLSDGYLLIGYIDLRRNIQTCYDDYSCVKHSDKLPEPGEMQREAALKGGDVVTVLEDRSILEQSNKTVCTSYNTTYYYVNKQMVPQMTCASSIVKKGKLEAKISRALVWRHDPAAANSDTNAKAIEAAFKAMEKTYADDEKHGIQASAALTPPVKPESMKGNNFNTSVFQAINSGNRAALEALNINGELNRWEDDKKHSALMVALLMNRPDSVRILLSIDKDLNKRDNIGLSALDYALGRADLPTIKAMLDAGYDLLLHTMQAGQPQFYAAINPDPTILSWIEAQGFDPKAKTTGGQTTLMLAAEGGNVANIRHLVSLGVGIEEKTGDKRTALMSALATGSLPATQALLELGADPKQIDAFDNNAAHFAVYGGNIETVKLMLDRHINFSALNSKQLNVLGVAIGTERWAIADFLLDHKLSIYMPGLKPASAAAFLISKNQPETLRRYWKAEPKLKAEMLNDSSWLLLASKSSGRQMIQLFHEAGANLDRPARDGTPPLIQAAIYGNLETLRALLELKANPNIVDKKGKTALYAATLAGNSEAVSILRAFGALG